MRVVPVNYARADDALVDKVKGVLSERGSVTFDECTNTHLVRDIAARHRATPRRWSARSTCRARRC